MEGFGDDKSMVLKFEWRWKYLSRKEKGGTLEKRMKALNKLMMNGKEYINLDYELNFVIME